MFTFKLPTNSHVDLLGEFQYVTKEGDFNTVPSDDLWGYRK